MFGVKKLGEKLHTALMAKAGELVTQRETCVGTEKERLAVRALVLVDIANIIKAVTVGENDD